MTVFITENSPGKDFSSAHAFGDFCRVFRKGVYPDNSEERSDEMVKIARSRLENFDAETDYVLMVGDPVGIAIVMAVLRETHPVISVLKYDRKAGGYYPIEIDLSNESLN